MNNFTETRRKDYSIKKTEFSLSKIEIKEDKVTELQSFVKETLDMFGCDYRKFGMMCGVVKRLGLPLARVLRTQAMEGKEPFGLFMWLSKREKETGDNSIIGG